MLKIKEYTPESGIPAEEKEKLIDFLYKHLDQFGDPKEDITRCVDFAMKEFDSFGGYVLMGYIDEQLAGAVVVNKTGMKGYIPENILVYIAVHRDFRGKGLGRQLMKKTHQMADGTMKLHVEPDNPARYLYEKVGYTNKYLEMRWTGDK
ncbi:MAG: GNAT family N-acetyltransferase [Bacteroidales bacterium]|nr:GNAT family N-acetyltransferase [Bacteroidales bacterium]MCF8398442.1 GNAT family N-acetyltransferase [Bacteroidales bacterium]